MWNSLKYLKSVKNLLFRFILAIYEKSQIFENPKFEKSRQPRSSYDRTEVFGYHDLIPESSLKSNNGIPSFWI